MVSLAAALQGTPAFLYDETQILAKAKLLARVREESACRVLYSIKALPFRPVLELLAPMVDGFSVSSLFEARLAASTGLPLHITTPGLRPAEIEEVGKLCSWLAFNSLEQFFRLSPRLGCDASVGLRVNPGLSMAQDPRYNPCGAYSKLGVPLDELAEAWHEGRVPADRLKGLHFHLMHGACSFAPLWEAMDSIKSKLGGEFLDRLDWINLGGGYLFDTYEDLTGLVALARNLRQDFGLTVYFEPGKVWVDEAGCLVSTVIDRFHRDGKTLLVLDTTVNHHPEVFEYQIRPKPAWVEPEEGETALLAGCTCLAGDVFGDYRFEVLPDVGDRLTFANVGAYSLIKANRFNGYNLPDIYAWNSQQGLRRLKTWNFQDYLDQWVADERV